MKTPLRIGFLGAGQMAQALASGFVAAERVAASDLVAYDPVEAAREGLRKRVPGLRFAASNAEVVREVDVFFLAVKPQHVNTVLGEIRPQITQAKLLVSIAAGVGIARLQQGLGGGRVIRVMPNTPALVGFGASAYSLGEAATSADGELIQQLLSAVGLAVTVEERLLDVVTGLSGSGPAYVFLVIEALAEGAVAKGLPRALALELAAQTVRGAAEMLFVEKTHPAVLKDRVASPGGTTLAGLAELERLGVRGAFMSAVAAATKRSQELGG